MESADCQYGHQIETWRGRDVCINCGIEDVGDRKQEKVQIKEHDHLCPAHQKHLILPTTCTFCQVIRKVREEERNSFIPVR